MKITQKSLIIAKMGGVVFALALPLFNIESAQAIIQVENFETPDGTNRSVSPSVIQGTSFTTDSENYTLNSVTTRLILFGPENDFVINLYSDNSDRPDKIIEELTTTDTITGDFNDYLFTPNNSVNLAANTTYWLIGSTTTNFHVWADTESFSETGAWTIGDSNALSFNGGSSWNFGSTPTQFSVDATSASVPFEFSPAIGLLLVSGLFGSKAVYERYRASKVKLED